MAASREIKRGGASAVALLLTVFWVSCGGQSATGAGAVGGTSASAGTSGPGGSSSGDAGRGVGGSRVGGAAGDGGGGQLGAGAGGVYIPLPGGAGGKGGSSGASGGVAEQAGSAGDAGACDTNALWQDLTRSAGATRCDRVDPPPEGDAVDQLHGAVVIDDEGRVVDNTGLTDAAKQAWLSELAAQRWLCLAGTTLGYSCQPIRG